jgi:putative addiction module component (TIGR02574 family)
MTTVGGVDFSHLSTEQRLELVDALLESIDDLPISAELAAELDRRSAAVHAGEMATHSWDEVKAAIWPKRP